MAEPSSHLVLAPAKPTLYVVDAFNFLFRAFHALPQLSLIHI